MVILRQKEFGKVWEGTKQAVKTGAKGAMIGATLMPGKLIALKKHKPKVALGLAGAGAIIGGAIGAKIGYSKGVDKYKYENDPKYRQKIDNEKRERIKADIKNSLKNDLGWSSEFDYNSWVKFNKELRNKLPDSLMNYIKFFKNTWEKNIKKWYDSIDPEELFSNEDFVIEFKSVFPIPISSSIAKDWLVEDELGEVRQITLATINSAGDDGWLVYDLDTETYGWDLPGDTKSLKKLLLENCESMEDEESLNSVQIQLIKEFKNKITPILK